jgi:DNA polymerase-3 subunit chi
VSSSESAREFDQLLWTFSADSFIPHTLCTDPAQTTAAVVIGWDQHPSASGDLINLTDAPPPGHARLDTIAEFVVNDEEAKAHGRQLWNTYKQLGYELQHHQL